MRHLGVGQHADLRLDQAHAVIDVAHLSGAHLDHGKAVLAGQLQQRQRHTQFVVQIAARGEYRPAFAQNGGQHFLDGGFAAGAGNTDYRAGELLTYQSGQVTQRQLAVMHQQLRQRIVHQVLDHRRSCAVFTGLGNKVMTVAAAASQGNKQTAALDGTGINADAVKMSIDPVKGRHQGFQQVAQAQRFKHGWPPTAAEPDRLVQYR